MFYNFFGIYIQNCCQKNPKNTRGRCRCSKLTSPTVKRLNLDANVAGSYRTILLPSAKCNLSFGINILVCIENKHTKNAKLCPCLAMAKQASRRFRTFSKVSVDNAASGLP